MNNSAIISPNARRKEVFLPDSFAVGLDVFEEALSLGKPVIFNSDQGELFSVSKFTVRFENRD